jgi:hypothetical protein
MLYSGSTMTTSINNHATSLIFMAFSEIDWSQPPVADREQWIRTKLMSASEEAGYSITVEYCEDYADIQFLKNSPCYDSNGVLRALPNFGIMVRQSGTCRGDLPGSKGNLKARAATFQHALITGTYSHINSPLISTMLSSCEPFLDDRLKHKVAKKLAVQNTQRFATHYEGTQPFTVSTHEFLRRYKLDGHDSESLFSSFSECGFGLHMNTFALRTVLERDYGLTTA